MRLRLRHPVAGDTFFTLGPHPLVLGRDKDAVDIDLAWDVKVSRRHARVWVEHDQVHFEDLDSTNGSWVGSQRLHAPVILTEETQVRMGQTVLDRIQDPADVVQPAAGDEDLAGVTIHMTADARFEGLGDLVGRMASERVNGFLEALHEIAGGLLHSTDPAALGAALRTLFRVVPSAQRIYLVNWPPSPAGDPACLVAEDASSPDTPPPLAISQGLASHATAKRQALLFQHGDPAPPLAPTASMVFHRIGSAIYVPLLEAGERVVGLLCVDSALPSPAFRSEDFQFVRAVADLLAAALAADKMRHEALRREMEGREWKARRDSMAAFLKIASHDLKNPLTVVQIAAFTLKTPNGESLREYLADRLADAARRARALIDSYLEVCEVEEGHALEVHAVELDPRQLVDEEFDFLGAALGDKQKEGLVFDNRIDCGTLWADLAKCRQIFSNLLSNAVKYSPQGGTITVSSEATPQGTVFTVRDQGVGISADDQQKLFEQFRRVGDPTIARGTGLGLWMTRALVEAHGGRIWVESEPSQGSAFHVLLPSAPPEEAPIPAEAQEVSHGQSSP